jgi:hypothetical protein
MGPLLRPHLHSYFANRYEHSISVHRLSGCEMFPEPRAVSMLNRRLTVDVIRAELAWVNETPDPNMCGCRHLLCCEQTSRAVGKCPRLPTEKVWSFKVGVFLLGVMDRRESARGKCCY